MTAQSIMCMACTGGVLRCDTSPSDMVMHQLVEHGVQQVMRPLHEVADLTMI